MFSSGETAVVSCYNICISCPVVAIDCYYYVSIVSFEKSYPVIITGPNFMRLEIWPEWLPLFYLSSSSRRYFAAIALYRVDA